MTHCTMPRAVGEGGRKNNFTPYIEFEPWLLCSGNVDCAKTTGIHEYLTQPHVL